jgi:uncharacterized surface protein with fasciclin (FAS1) repeats
VNLIDGIYEMNCKIIISSLFILAITEVAQGGKHYRRKYSKPAPLGDLVDVAVGAGAFTTLVKIVSDLGLVDTLKGVEAATVFAPTDAAFAKLPAGTLESLTADQAKAIVARHVIPGATVLAKDVATGEVPTLGGETIGLIKTRRGGVKVVGPTTTVNVVKANVLASNGVIHVVDNVIL